MILLLIITLMESVNVLDLVCRSTIKQSLPLNVLCIIHDYVTRKEKRINRRRDVSDGVAALRDDQWNIRGSRYYRKSKSGVVVTRVRLKRAFRCGR